MSNKSEILFLGNKGRVCYFSLVFLVGFFNDIFKPLEKQKAVVKIFKFVMIVCLEHLLNILYAS